MVERRVPRRASMGAQRLAGAQVIAFPVRHRVPRVIAPARPSTRTLRSVDALLLRLVVVPGLALCTLGLLVIWMLWLTAVAMLLVVMAATDMTSAVLIRLEHHTRRGLDRRTISYQGR